MIIKKIILANLRNHSLSEFQFSDGLNILYGLNGAGKTTILEAITIASISKSFMPIQDISLIRKGETFYSVAVEALSDLKLPYKIQIKYSSGQRKLINSSHADNQLPKDIIGEMPVVILSPDFKSITFGAPQDRRQFVDSILSQSSKKYIELIMSLKRALKQRNALLGFAKKDFTFDYSQILPWTDLLIETSAEIIIRRNKFINEFIPYFLEAYALVSKEKEPVSIEYKPFGIDNPESFDKTHIINILRKIYDRCRNEEFRRGTTLFGPQKDDFKIIINGGLAKDFASQGQHKTLLISLKLAEFNYIKDKNATTPIILFDDIFSELDDLRSNEVLKIVDDIKAQTFITLTNPDKLKAFIGESHNAKYFHIDNGKQII